MGLFDGFWDSIRNDNLTGWLGETYTEFELGLVKIFGRDGKMLRNIYIPTDDGGTSEIDVLYITQKGIFVLESKNYSGWIFGDEKSMYWTACLPNGQKNKFYNPIKQNQTHIKWLDNYLMPQKVPLFSIIVFSERCTLKKIVVDNKTPVINRDRLYTVIRKLWDSNPDMLSIQQVTELWEGLSVLTNVSETVKLAHIRQIEEKCEKTKMGADNSIVTGKICPRCGSELIQRTARKGENAGKQFYGCASFPKCRYVENIKGESS